jgi:hypothetical protein
MLRTYTAYMLWCDGCVRADADPEERHDLSGSDPAKLHELTARLAQLQNSSYQTMNYTAGFDQCDTVDQVAAKHRGFVAPPCTFGNGSHTTITPVAAAGL